MGMPRITLMLLAAIMLAGSFIYSWAVNHDTVRVVQVFDGDTVRLADGRKVRLVGVDAPEIDSPYGKAEPFGEQSKAYLTEMVLDRDVRLVIPPDDPVDRYGRTLGYLYLDGVLVNGRIIRDGYARCYRAFWFEYRDLFYDFEREARRYRRGIWQ